jgi:NAD(P)-dependent dehydrogenase (short-subunit alcohol dehydrogenase family)
MPTDLTNRAAIITGGKRLGAAVALELAGRGMDIAMSFNRSRTEAEEVSAAVRGLGRRAFIYQVDLSRSEDTFAFVGRAVADLGRLDVLVNMASIYKSVPFEQTDDTVWNAVLAVDLTAAFSCSRAAVPHMRAAGGGRIINFSDWVARSGRPRYKGYLPYFVAKYGIIGLTEGLALELADYQILVNAVAPGPIMAPPGTTDEEYKAVEAATPLGRWGGEAEVVRAVMFLIESDFVTGETIRVDGGRHVR